VSSTAPRPASVPTVKVAAGTTAVEALREAGVRLDGPDGAVVVRDLASDTLRDLAWVPDEDAEVEPTPANSPDGLAVLRHSAAHVMAQAVQELFPGTLLASARPSRTASTTTSPRPIRSPRRTCPPSRRRWPRSSRPASASTGAR